MTTQTPTPSDNERLSRLEGIVEQMNQRLPEIRSQLNSQRPLFFTGMGIMWATMVGGFIAILTFNS